MLRELLPEECVSKDIILRVLPHQLTKLPTIKGYLLYSTALRTLQLGLTSFYLNPHARFHITNIKVDEPTSSMSSDELVNLSLDDNIIENSTPLAASEMTGQAISNYTTKVTVKWRTCLGGCPHLKNSGSTTSAKMGSFSFENFDISKMLPGDGTQPSALIHEAQSRLSSSFLRKDHEQQKMKMASSSPAKHLERVITGIFIFELNAENDHIVVLTIDNCDVLESRETDLEGFGFAPQA
ncbi:DEKNAAC100459 [Brettanomyces naardenensis]|uniref:DEKNAAC100459 n=1 Tax=Brettanomyces naardenensis TaxID=13370 RepID=A0A448YF09_BRENA|nr:DEKNAAC100459 [Brettanomyces naardenensis]